MPKSQDKSPDEAASRGLADTVGLAEQDAGRAQDALKQGGEAVADAAVKDALKGVKDAFVGAEKALGDAASGGEAQAEQAADKAEDAVDEKAEEIDHAAYHALGQPHISAELFAASHRTPNDQLAAFLFWAKQELRDVKLTIAQWEEHLINFFNRPVR